MCGIFGVWQPKDAPVNLAYLQQATNALRHRGPDDEGYLLVDTARGHTVACRGADTDPQLALPPLTAFSSEAFDLALGFRRLAILDLSPAGHQPMVSANGRFWMVYNGEVYNYLELRQELAGCGHTFHTGADTEVILAAYSQWGADCLKRFNGMWAFAIWDQAAQTLFLARDRFGIKPLYYTADSLVEPQRFAFASEIKALVGAHGLPFQPSGKQIYRYVLAGLLPNPQGRETFFEHVFSLPPGHYLVVNRQAVTVQQYWTLPYAEQAACPDNVAGMVAAYRDQFTDAVRLHLRADVPVGTCLSGGVDSSSLVCTMNQLLSPVANGHQQQTFSAVYTTTGRYNERAYIEKVVASAHVAGHLTFPTVERLQAELEKLVWHQDEPFLSPSPFAQWCVMQKAHEQGVTVLLDGQGADETLAGYRPYGVFLRSLFHPARIGQLRGTLHDIQQVTALSSRSLLRETLLSSLPEQFFIALRERWWQLRGAQAIFRPEFAQQWKTSVTDGYYQHAADLSKHLEYGLLIGLPHLLRYEDRNSMAHSIEARVPFLDVRLVELSFNQAAPLRIYQGWTKWILRKAMEGSVPPEVLWRKDKVGFETPQEEWMTALLAQEANLLGDNALSGEFLELPVVRQRLQTMLQERKPNRSLLWRLINLEIWLRVWRGAAVAS
ncbi:MAG: asparagine synthase (glutamine-hydrolyzing) [Caldilineaceae bacterium]